jgi:hypothetical protein
MNTQTIEQEPLLSKIAIKMISDPVFEKGFKNYLQTKIPSLYADIESAYSNPNCTCVKKLESYVESNKTEIANLIFEYSQTTEVSVENYIKYYNNSESTRMNLSGRILKTTLKNWTSFSQQINNAVYKNFSVVKEGDDILVFFL